LRHQESSFRGQLNFELYSQCWLPEGEPSARIVLAHGVAEHSSRYTSFANFLASRGLAVYSFDYRGHGRSPGSRGFVEHFSYFEEDLARFISSVQGLQPAKKLFLFGHSMGAIVSLACAVESGAAISGLIVSGSALRIRPQLPIAVRGAFLSLAALLPRLPFSKLDSSTISKDKRVVESYDRDPLVFRGKLTARLAIELVWEMWRVEKLLPLITTPILIVHGGADRLSLPEGARLVFDRVASKDKELKIYAGLYHEILNEPENQTVMQDIFEWIGRHLGRGQ
jgi:acylglycerol lipase